MDRFKAKMQEPMRHVRAFIEPDGQNYESQLPDGYRLHGNTAANLSASITHNALEMNQWHEMEATVHSQFGTVDNPVLIFTSDSSWRIVICMGPGIEDDSYSHEKMFYFLREGPAHRCHICGQVFKLVRLKDEGSELNDYYSTMFASITHFEVAEEDMAVSLTSYFGDRPQPQMQTVAGTNVYIHVNNDDADRIMIDPAYKMEKLKEVHEKIYAFHEAYRLVDEQMKGMTFKTKMPFGKDLYETWFKIEKSIMKFDRIFNKVEKFEARALTDPVNHARREKRMITGKNKRWGENYTYFFGNLTEEESQYRDYFESDLELDPEDEYIEEKFDEYHLAQQGQFDAALYDFVDTTHSHDAHENYDDMVEQKIFKFKYRQYSDTLENFEGRNRRMIDRFLERAKTRDPILEQDLNDLFATDARDNTLAQYYNDPSRYRDVATEETRPFREYMVNEAIQQYKDYFEDDAEEAQFFEYLENFANRDKIRFMEIFEDFTVDNQDYKQYVMIQKREYNPQLSYFSNMVLDIVDFKDRVRPLQRDVAMMEKSAKFQKQNVEQMQEERAAFRQMLDGINQDSLDRITSPEEHGEGYSSAEIPELRTEEETEVEF